MKKAIERMLAQLAEQRAKAESIKLVLDERDLTDEETKDFDACLTAIKKLHADIDQASEAERVMLREIDTKAVSVQVAPAVALQGELVDKELPKGHGFVHAIRCLLNAKGNVALAAELAEVHYPETPSLAKVFKGQAMGLLPKFGEIKAAVVGATTGSATWAGPLAYAQNLTSEFVDLLYPATIMGKMSGMRDVPFNVSIPRMTGGVTGGWVGEGGWKPVNAGAFDRITLTHDKVAVIVVFTEEMLRFSNPKIDVVMQNNIVNAFAGVIDASFIDYTSTGSTSKPAPINGNGSGAALQAVPSTGNTVALITDDLSAAMGKLTSANQPMTNGYWIMSERTWQYLSTVRTTQDIYGFREELLRGQLLGHPVIKSSVVPIDMGVGTDESFITLVDAGSIIIAREGVMFDASNQATLQMDDAPTGPAAVSMWQTNQVAVKGEQYITWQKARDTLASVITGVAY